MPRRQRKHAKLPIFIFDFGGVVIKWKNNNPIFDSIAKRYGVPRNALRALFERNLPVLEAGDVTIREFLEEALAKFGKKLRKGDSPDELWTEPFERLVKFRLGTVRVIESLRRSGYEVYLFSNTSAPHVKFFKRMGWEKMVDGFIASCELRSNKPSPVAFARALEAVGAKASEVAFIDDKEANVEGARGYGIRWAFRFTTVPALRRDVASLTSPIMD